MTLAQVSTLYFDDSVEKFITCWSGEIGNFGSRPICVLVRGDNHNWAIGEIHPDGNLELGQLLQITNKINELNGAE